MLACITSSSYLEVLIIFYSERNKLVHEVSQKMEEL